MITFAWISPSNVAAFKAIRLCALGESPTAFGSTYAEEAAQPEAQWLARAARCAGPAQIGLLAMEGASPCGIVRASPDDQDPTVAWVESMWVDPARRRTGIGRRLVDEIIAWARERGLLALKLSVTGNNEPAIGLYESLGFRPTGNCQPHPREATLTECEMSLPLSKIS